MAVSVSMYAKEQGNGMYGVTVTDVIIGSCDPHYIGRLIIAHAAFFKNWFQTELPVSITYGDGATTLNFKYEIKSPVVMESLRKYFNCTNGTLRFENINPAGEYSDLYRSLHGKLLSIRSINDKCNELAKLAHDIYIMHDVQVVRGNVNELRLEAIRSLKWPDEVRAKYLMSNNAVRGVSMMAQALINEHLDPLTL